MKKLLVLINVIRMAECALALESNAIRLETRTEGFGQTLATATETKGVPDGSALEVWNTTVEANGWKTLTSGSTSVKVCVLNTSDVAVRGGRMTTNETWQSGVVHLLRNNVVVPSGTALTLANGAITKFTEGVQIVVESGGTLVAQGTMLADSADDAVGGDTNMDGDAPPASAGVMWVTGCDLVTVRYEDAGGTLFPTRSYTTGQTYGELPVPERDGAIFKGWWTAANGGGVQIRATDVVTTSAPVLFAAWEALGLSLDPVTIDCGAEAGSGSISVTANADWTVTKGADAGWITVTSASGSGNGTIDFTYAANGAVVPRTAVLTVTLSGTEIAREVIVSQAGAAGVAAPVITPADGTVFEGNARKVSITCATAGARVYYTLDGSIPTENSTLLASKAFNVFDTTTIKARAFKDGMAASEITTAKLIRKRGLAEALNIPLWSVTTDPAFPWVTDDAVAHDGDVCVKSGVISDGEDSGFQTTVSGCGKLSFWWKASCEDDPDYDDWDYAVFLVDGVEKARIDGVTDWEEVEVSLSAGTHTLRWEYRKDESWGEGEDCVWVDQVEWQEMATETGLPMTWLESQGLVASGSSGDAVSAAVTGDVDGDGMTAYEEYVAGTDPNDPESSFKAEIAVGADGKPVVTWTPDLLEERQYRVLGKTNLDDAEWLPVEDGHRFFKVEIVGE